MATLSTVATTPGNADSEADKRKMRKEAEECKRQGLEFIPLDVEVGKSLDSLDSQNPPKSQLLEYKKNHIPVYKADIDGFMEPKLEKG